MDKSDAREKSKGQHTQFLHVGLRQPAARPSGRDHTVEPFAVRILGWMGDDEQVLSERCILLPTSVVGVDRADLRDWTFKGVGGGEGGERRRSVDVSGCEKCATKLTDVKVEPVRWHTARVWMYVLACIVAGVNSIRIGRGGCQCWALLFLLWVFFRRRKAWRGGTRVAVCGQAAVPIDALPVRVLCLHWAVAI